MHWLGRAVSCCWKKYFRIIVCAHRSFHGRHRRWLDWENLSSRRWILNNYPHCEMITIVEIYNLLISEALFTRYGQTSEQWTESVLLTSVSDQGNATAQTLKGRWQRAAFKPPQLSIRVLRDVIKPALTKGWRYRWTIMPWGSGNGINKYYTMAVARLAGLFSQGLKLWRWFKDS